MVQGLRYTAVIPMRRMRLATRRRPMAWPSCRRKSRSIRAPGKGILEMQLVNPAHQSQLGISHGRRVIVGRRASHAEQLALPDDRQGCVRSIIVLRSASPP